MFLYVYRLVVAFFFFSSRRRHTRCLSDWSSDVCSSDLASPLRGEQLLDVIGAHADGDDDDDGISGEHARHQIETRLHQIEWRFLIHPNRPKMKLKMKPQKVVSASIPIASAAMSQKRSFTVMCCLIEVKPLPPSNRWR